jgi:tagatose 6-phosphate kinase
MTPFAAITLNASVDVTLTLPRLDPGTIHRSGQRQAVAGGKGNNLARVLACLGREVTASGFTGGDAGNFIERSLREEGVIPGFLRAPGESRTCLTLVEEESGRITEIREPGDPIPSDLAAAFLDRAPDLIGDAAFVAICGSLPPGLPDDYLARLVERLRRPGRVIAVDASGEPLRRALAAHADVIAPNTDELADLAGIGAERDPVAAGEALRQRSGATGLTVLAKLGAAGAVAITPQGAWSATPPQIEAVNPVGSGDAFLAGWMAGSAESGNAPDALRLAVACGAAAALQSRIGYVDPADVLRLAQLVTVEAA